MYPRAKCMSSAKKRNATSTSEDIIVKLRVNSKRYWIDNDYLLSPSTKYSRTYIILLYTHTLTHTRLHYMYVGRTGVFLCVRFFSDKVMCLCVQLYAAVSTTGIAFIHNLIIPNNGNINNSTIRDMYVFNYLGREEWVLVFQPHRRCYKLVTFRKLKKKIVKLAIFIYLKFVWACSCPRVINVWAALRTLLMIDGYQYGSRAGCGGGDGGGDDNFLVM